MWSTTEVQKQIDNIQFKRIVCSFSLLVVWALKISYLSSYPSFRKEWSTKKRRKRFMLCEGVYMILLLSFKITVMQGHTSEITVWRKVECADTFYADLMYYFCCLQHCTGEALLQDPKNRHGNDMLLNGHAPRHGDIMRMPLLARTFRVGDSKADLICWHNYIQN